MSLKIVTFFCFLLFSPPYYRNQKLYEEEKRLRVLQMEAIRILYQEVCTVPLCDLADVFFCFLILKQTTMIGLKTKPVDVLFCFFKTILIGNVK